jgi:hypothetical protein
MFRKTHIVAILMLLACFGLAQSAPKYSNEFLSIGIGARAQGMSNSIIASCDDVTVGFWNPSRLPQMQGERQLGLMHAEYFAGIAKFDYVGLGFKIDDKSALAFSIVRSGIDNIPNTTELIDNQGNINFDKITTFSVTDLAFFASYGRFLKQNELSTGGSIKVIRKRMGDFANSWGFGGDLSVSYAKNTWLFAAVLRDASSTFNAWSFSLSDKMKEVFTLTGNVIPENSLEISMPRLLLATGKNFYFSPSFTLLVEGNIDMTFDKQRNTPIKTDVFSIDPHIGIELNFKKIAFFRAGLGNIQKETNSKGVQTTTFQPNMGIGIRIKDFIAIDYALTDIGDNSIALYSNIFSIRLSFNKVAEAK